MAHTTNDESAERLARMVLTWWDKAQNMTSGSRGEHNVFNSEPEFVEFAHQVVSMCTTHVTEQAAIAALQAAAQALMRAQVASEAVGFGSQVLGPLSDAARGLNYALDTASGRN